MTHDRQKILHFVEQLQAGRSGIYPWRVAQSVRDEFGISMSEAISIVLAHVLTELAAQSR